MEPNSTQIKSFRDRTSLSTCCCRREEAADRQQLVEEVAAEVEELLAYAADTLNPQQLATLDISGIAEALCSRLSRQAMRRPGAPLRLLLLSSEVTQLLLLALSSSARTDPKARRILPATQQQRRRHPNLLNDRIPSWTQEQPTNEKSQRYHQSTRRRFDLCWAFCNRNMQGRQARLPLADPNTPSRNTKSGMISCLCRNNFVDSSVTAYPQS